MADNRIYETIAKATGGNIYIGVVGPVRTGKSTFIHKVMQSAVIPNIENEFDRERTIDELPQSGSGRTITTTEPKFIPGEAVGIKIGETSLKVRMIDCVGYMVNGAIGDYEDEQERMVMTPWSDSPMKFSQAGEIGTEKVIKEHSTIAMLVSTDGSICDIPRESYISAEERIVSELKAAKKPFAIILNSANPDSDAAHSLATELEEKYSAPVALVNCTKVNSEDVREILSLILGEFPVREVNFTLPKWYDLLPDDDKLCTKIMNDIRSFASEIERMSDIERLSKSCDSFGAASLDAATGCATIDIPVSREHFYEVMSNATSLSIDSDRSLFETLLELSLAKQEYDKIKLALTDAKELGYGIVMPSEEELRISEPTVVKQGNGYGIKVSASADTIHMIRADIRADVCPVIGSREQADEVIKLMLGDYEENPKNLLSTKMLGRSLYDLVNDGMNAKLLHIPNESREKLGQTLEKIVNEGSNGLICILV